MVTLLQISYLRRVRLDNYVLPKDRNMVKLVKEGPLTSLCCYCNCWCHSTHRHTKTLTVLDQRVPRKMPILPLTHQFCPFIPSNREAKNIKLKPYPETGQNSTRHNNYELHLYRPFPSCLFFAEAVCFQFSSAKITTQIQ